MAKNGQILYRKRCIGNVCKNEIWKSRLLVAFLMPDMHSMDNFDPEKDIT